MKYLLKPVCIVLFIGCFGHVKAQVKIFGQIKDINGALPFSNVLLLNPSDSLLIKGAVANNEGFFMIENYNAGTFLVKSSSIGYKEAIKSVTLAAKDELNLGTILLIEDAEQLNEVIIKAEKPLFEQKIDRTVINVQSSITASAGTALDILSKSPGVTVDRGNNVIALAGKQGVRIMINGKMSRMPLSAAVQMLNGMNADNVESIELITTPPAKYEAEGDAGIINIVLKKSADNGTNGSYSAFGGYGVHEKWGGSMNINHRNKKLNFFGNYSYRHDHTFQIFGNNRIIADQKNDNVETDTKSNREAYIRTHNAEIGADYQIGDKTIIGSNFSYYNSGWDMDAVNNVNYSTNSVRDSYLTLGTIEVNDTKYYVSNVNLSHDFDSKNNLKVELDYIFYDSYNPTNYSQRNYDNQNALTSSTTFNSSKITPLSTWVPRIDYALQINDNSSFEFGLKAAINSLKNDVSVNNQVGNTFVKDTDLSNISYLDENIYAAYSSYNFKLTPKIDMKAGLRYEHTITDIIDGETRQSIVNRNYGRFFPSLFINKKINDNNSWVLSYSRRISRPTFRDLAPFVIFLDPNTFAIGNVTLYPGITDSYKAEYRFKTYLATLQYSRDDKPIARFQPTIDAVNNRQITTANNLKYRDNFNISFTIPFTIAKWWEIQCNVNGMYQVTYAEQNNDVFKLEAYSMNLNTTNTLKFSKQWSFEISGFYGSPGYFGISKFKSYGAVNLGLEKKLNNENGTFRLTVTDAFDQQNFRMEVIQKQQNLNVRSLFDLESTIFNLSFSRNFGNNKLKKLINDNNSSQEEQRRL